MLGDRQAHPQPTWLNQLDVRVAKLLRFRGTRAMIGADVYNATNSAAIQTYNNTGTSDGKDYFAGAVAVRVDGGLREVRRFSHPATSQQVFPITRSLVASLESHCSVMSFVLSSTVFDLRSPQILFFENVPRGPAMEMRSK